MQSSNDWSKLSDFLDTVNNHFANVEEVLDIDRALWMMAFQNLFVCLDSPINSIPKNFYLFKDNNGRFSPILWNMNQSFGIFTNGLPSPINNQDLQQLDIFHSSSNNQNIMTSKIFSSDRYKKMYVAHMRTIVNEHLANNNYYNRALVLQQLIDNIVSVDPNLFHSYSDYQSNLTNSISNVIGVSELINSRVNFIQSTTEFSASPPTISSVVSNISTALPHTTINLTANITNTNYAYLAYRFKFSEKFTKIQMMDDGNNGDGAAGDGVFGITLDVDARDVLILLGRILPCSFKNLIRNPTTSCTYNFNINEISTVIVDKNIKKNMMKISSYLGQETSFTKNTPLIYIYDDGTIEKKITID